MFWNDSERLIELSAWPQTEDGKYVLTHIETDAPYVTSNLYPLHLASSVDAFNCYGCPASRLVSFQHRLRIPGMPGQSVPDCIPIGDL
jgi:hypothetical protein